MNELESIYGRLYSAFGPQRWWPGDSPFEVAVGAILTQNTSWHNVERAIANLKGRGLLGPRKMHGLAAGELAGIIRPAGYFNIKAKRLKAFLKLLFEQYGGSMKRMDRDDTAVLRRRLLGVNGIGPETADSILLYALHRPVFVVDAYTKRVLSRHGILGRDEPYEVYQGLFHSTLKADAGLFNEYHALLVRIGKSHCRPSRPLCDECPLGGWA